MNHYIATYIDFIQTIGIVCIFTLILFVLRKLYLDNEKENYIEHVKIKVDE